MAGMETFVVRLWSEERVKDEPSTLRGVVEHVRSGSSRRFGAEDELVAFLRDTVAQHPSRPDDRRAEAIRHLLEVDDAVGEGQMADG